MVAAILVSCTAQAQLSLKRQKYDSIAARYKNEHAVYLEDSRNMTIYEEDGEMKAKSTVVAEKLFISEKSLNRYNEDPVYRATAFDYVYDLGAVASIPYKDDYKLERIEMDFEAGVVKPPLYSGLSKGSITRTFFTEQMEDLRMPLPTYSFGNDIPTVYGYLEVRAPRFVKMGFLLKGADTSMIKRTVKFDGADVVYRFSAKNLPGMKYYNRTRNTSYYQTHVIPYIISFRMTGAKKDSVINGTMDAHNRHKFGFVHGLNYKTDTFLTRKAKELTRNTYADREKVNRIFDWVQQNFHYEAWFTSDLEGFVPNPADTVCKRMYGDCKDMSSVLVAMCQSVGVKANYAVIGTNDKPYTHDEIHTQNLYNHMICAVKIDGEWVFPDGTTRVQPLGADRWDIQDKEAMVMLDANHHEVVKIPEMPATRNTITNNTVMNLDYGDVTGTTYQHYTGYEAWEIEEALAHINRKEERDDLVRDLTMRGNKKFVVKNYDIDVHKTGDKDMSISTSYVLGNHVQRVKNEHFVNMNLSHIFTDLRMNDEDRKFPMYLPFKNIVRETITLNLPKGYRVRQVPKSAKGGVPGLWSYSLTYKVNNAAHTVTLTREFELKTMKIEPSQFAANNKLVDELKKQYKETVVLTGK